MGHAYLDYAQKKPLEYRLMFGTPWPEPAQHPELIENAVHAFDILRNNLRKTHGDSPEQRARRTWTPCSSGPPCTAWRAFRTPMSCGIWFWRRGLWSTSERT
jgi:hypothetical protein